MSVGRAADSAGGYPAALARATASPTTSCTHLAHVPDFSVISRTTAIGYKGSGRSGQEISPREVPGNFGGERGLPIYWEPGAPT